MNATSYDNLSWAEKQWAELYVGRNEIFVTGMAAFIMHEVVYFGRYLPFFICDFIPAFQKYKLQPVRTFIFNMYQLTWLHLYHHLLDDHVRISSFVYIILTVPSVLLTGKGKC
jgi:methylsterol monooxygenase